MPTGSSSSLDQKRPSRPILNSSALFSIRSRVRRKSRGLIFLALLPGCVDAARQESAEALLRPPELRIEGASSAPEYAARIDRIDPRRFAVGMQLLGLEDPGEPILLVLAAEDSLAARSVPGWIAGFALSDRGVAVLFPARTPSYPDSTFEELVLHEVGHILVHRATSGADVPRWFNEGLALYIGRPWRLEDHSRVTWALVSGRQVSLTDLEPYFHRSREAANHAYALAGAFVQDLVQREGPTAVADILTAVRGGARFAEAFLAVTGETLQDTEKEFWERHTFLYRWIPILGSSATLWLVITALALVAFRRRRTRDRLMHEQWEQEDRFYDETNDSQPS